jgi:hypothetical protein
MDKPVLILNFFDGVVNKVITGEISEPTNPRGLSSLMFLIRMVSSTDAQYIRAV